MNRFDRERLRSNLERMSTILVGQGFDVRPLVFESRATAEEVDAVERSLGRELPTQLRALFLEVSRHVEFRWFTPQGHEFPKPFHGNFSGDLHFSLGLIENFERSRQEWIRVCFPDPDDDYDVIWHEKFAFFEVGNGDHIALDGSGAVIYLSHDDGEGHGYQLASSLEGFLGRWVPLGCPGGEDSRWMPFVQHRNSGINPASDNGLRWQEMLSL